MNYTITPARLVSKQPAKLPRVLATILSSAASGKTGPNRGNTALRRLDEKIFKKIKKGQLIHHSLDINTVVLETFQYSAFCSHINMLHVTSLLRMRLLVNSAVEAGSPGGQSL